jgi:aerobic carbon-monoxide dehydrogenase medium subunit
MPTDQITDYHRPGDLASVWALLRDGDGSVRLLGGGTDLVVACPTEVRTLVDLARAGLDRIVAEADGSLRLGAMATFTELLEHPDVRAHGTGVLAEMLGQVGSVLHRNSATLGGHLARGRMSDVIPVLVALDASVVIHAGEDRELPLQDYHATAPGPHVVTEVRLPTLPPRSAAAFLRFSRTSFDHAILNGCCRIDVEGGTTGGQDEAVQGARVVIGETAVLGRRITAAEEAILGAPLDAARIEAAAQAAEETVATRGDWVASAEYRRHLAGVTVRRCLTEAAQRLREGTA